MTITIADAIGKNKVKEIYRKLGFRREERSLVVMSPHETKVLQEHFRRKRGVRK